MMNKNQTKKQIEESIAGYKSELSEIFESINDFRVFKANFLERTKKTSLTVLNVLRRTKNRNAQKFLIQNLEEEMGLDFPKSHLELLQDAIGSVDSFRVTEGTKQYLQRKDYIFKRASFDEVVGDFIAHELVASDMLQRIKDKFGNKFHSQIYFDIHLNGTEDRHGEDALKLLKLTSDLNQVLVGVNGFLSIQLNFFKSLAS